MEINKEEDRPLSGFRVIELGQLIAGPFCGTLLAYFGAEVIKVEPPTGDPMRHWRVLGEDGTSLWWRSIARNKKCISLNLKTSKAREILRQLVKDADVLIENFRPGTMEAWNLGPSDLEKINPNLIYTRISGYGQTGPYAHRPGFASVTEGFSGFRYLNGFPNEAPVRPNLSLGDSLAGIHAALGVCLSLIQRLKQKPESEKKKPSGQTIDIALFEAFYNLMESVVPEYDVTGAIRGPSGTTVTGIAPTNTYPCKDGKYVIIGGNGDSIFKRLMIAIDQPELAEDARFKTNPGRVEHQDFIDNTICDWTKNKSLADVLAAMESANVPAGPIYSVADMMEDPHFQARSLFESVTVCGKRMKIPAITPKLSKTPGQTQWAGPELKSHNHEVLGKQLGYNEEDLRKLETEGVI